MGGLWFLERWLEVLEHKMTPESVIEIFRSALYIIVLILAVVILPSLIVGVIVSVFQAATQINEATLSFLPRLMMTLFILIFFGSWIISKLVDFSKNLILEIPDLIG